MVYLTARSTSNLTSTIQSLDNHHHHHNNNRLIIGNSFDINNGKLPSKIYPTERFRKQRLHQSQCSMNK
ncbi:hypothetical protein DERP_003983 [Dermatophagoides pteronyssinus]|uniref:Uncharacterized protein n=1 Tax=Dermatophagoides pteronyssinus TaxID=6956 RepID=A0ABQ8J7S8_DERPT|nr:hypothetical protein DERP_003983 [Dermatophagoides pteronyssinus]